MRSPIMALVLLVLAAGCSSGGQGAAAVSAPATSAPSRSAPAAGGSASSAPTSVAPRRGEQSAVPAEKNPPGDIPDNIAFVRYKNMAGYSFTHPEGWAETTRGSSVTFTDKLNGVYGIPGRLTAAPTAASARQQDVPALMRMHAAFELRGVTTASGPGGSGVRIVYRRNSAPDPVTGRQYRDEVERYELVAHGREMIVELYGPVGADNVDAYKAMITSLRIA